MNEIYVTLVGNAAADPRQFQFEDGSRVTSVRVATSRRYLDRRTQEWRTEPTTYYTVRCYRTLADHVARSVEVGHPVVVYGRLRMREVGSGEDRRLIPEVDAICFGHDLRWGVTRYEKTVRPRAALTAPEDAPTLGQPAEALAAGHPRHGVGTVTVDDVEPGAGRPAERSLAA